MDQTRFRSARFPNSAGDSSASGRAFWFIVLLALTLSALALPAENPTPTPGKSAEAKAPNPEPTSAPSQEETLTAMMIPGQPVKGMKYAHRDENDKVIMEFETEIARKIDDDHIEMENLKIVAFDDEGKKIDIAMPISVLDVTTRILVGKAPITIKREDFEIVGDTGEFNTKTRFAKLLGNVKMTIMNTENFDQ